MIICSGKIHLNVKKRDALCLKAWSELYAKISIFNRSTDHINRIVEVFRVLLKNQDNLHYC